MLRRWFPLWLVATLAPACLGWEPALLSPVAVDSASLLAQGLSNRFAPAMAGEPAYRTWHLRTVPADDPAELALSLTLALGGPEDRLDLGIAYDNTAWIPIANVRWRVGPQTLDLSPWVRGGRFRVRLGLTAQRPERCWFSDPSWRGRGVEADSPDEQWLPRACWWQPALAAQRDRREARGLPPGPAVEPGGGRLETSPVAEWEPCADGWRATRWSPPQGEQVALVLDGQADGAGLKLGRTVDLSHKLPYAPVGLVLDAETLAAPPALVVTTRDRPILRAVATGPLALRLVSSGYGFVGLADHSECSAYAAVVNCRSGSVDGQLAIQVNGRDGKRYVARSGYRFPPGPSYARVSVNVPDEALLPRGNVATIEVAAGNRVSDAVTAPLRPFTAPGGPSVSVDGPAPPHRLQQALRDGQWVALVVDDGRFDLLGAALCQRSLYEAVRPVTFRSLDRNLGAP